MEWKLIASFLSSLQIFGALYVFAFIIKIWNDHLCFVFSVLYSTTSSQHLVPLISHQAQGSSVYFLFFFYTVFHVRLFIKSRMLCLASTVLIMNTVTLEQRNEYLKAQSVYSTSSPHLSHCSWFWTQQFSLHWNHIESTSRGLEGYRDRLHIEALNIFQVLFF